MTASANSNPKVVIGVPVYNEGKYIARTLESLLAQDYSNFTIYISDNCSTDDTWQICQKYAAADSRIVLHQNEANCGAAANFERTYWHSPESVYFMWAAGHDQFEPNFVSSCVEVLESNSDIILAYPKAEALDRDGTKHPVLTPPIDTRGLRNFERMMTVLWGMHNCYPFYGLHRRAALNYVNMRPGGVAPDVVIMAELSLIGYFAYTDKSKFYLRYLADAGSFEVQMAKLGETIAHPYRLFFRFWKNIMGAIMRRTTDAPTRIGLIASATACLLTKYWWIPSQMNDEKKSASKKSQIPAAKAEEKELVGAGKQ